MLTISLLFRDARAYIRNFERLAAKGRVE